MNITIVCLFDNVIDRPLESYDDHMTNSYHHLTFEKPNDSKHIVIWRPSHFHILINWKFQSTLKSTLPPHRTMLRIHRHCSSSSCTVGVGGFRGEVEEVEEGREVGGLGRARGGCAGGKVGVGVRGVGCRRIMYANVSVHYAQSDRGPRGGPPITGKSSPIALIWMCVQPPTNTPTHTHTAYPCRAAISWETQPRQVHRTRLSFE